MTKSRTMRRRLLAGMLILLALVASRVCADETAGGLVIPGIAGLDGDFIRGADISSLAQIEEVGGVYRDQAGQPRDLLAILKENGVNWVRLRLWHNPVNEQVVLEGGKIISNKGQRVGGGNNGLERTVALAKRAKAMGFRLLLDFHYSDFWADPRTQRKPAAWKNLDSDGLAKEIKRYTGEVYRRLVKEGARPDMVQLGNETNGGMLWPEGKTWRAPEDGAIGGYEGFARLLGEAGRAIREADPVRSGPGRTRLAIHLADGGDNGLYRSMFDRLTAAKVDYDVIGLSFYPYWHGELAGLSANLADLAARYGKDLVVMETAYGFTTADGDNTGNVFKVFDGPSGGFLPTVQGQATEVRAVMAAVASAPGGKGRGVFYWEPGWIPVTGAGWRTGEGDSWENQAMFDFSGRALPSLGVFKAVREADPALPVVPKATETVRLTLVIGDRPVLPARIKTIYTDDSWRWNEAEWDPVVLGTPGPDSLVVATGRLKDSPIPARAEIRFTRTRNLLEDGSFESGKLTGWTLDDPAHACLAESNAANAKSGSWTYKYWLDKPFQATLSRTFSGLENGRYTLVCQAAGGGGEKSITLFARDSGAAAAERAIVNTGWQKWKEYRLTGIVVANGQCTIGVSLDALAGNWGNFDDFEFFREPEGD